MGPVAAVDVGSNAIRFAIGERSDQQTLKILFTDRKPVSLGRSVFARKDRAISSDVMSGAHDAFRSFLSEIRNYGVERYRAVGTSALRDASNQQEFIAMAIAAGLDLSVISGDEEARLIRLAVERTEDISRKRAALLDIGGGSAEFSIITNGRVQFSTSEKVGTIRLLKMLAEHKISTERFGDRVRRVIAVLGEKIERSIEGAAPEVLLATGGNIEELGNLRAKLIPGKEKTNKIRFDELCVIIDELEPLTPEERQARFQFRADRADVILPASIILREVMHRTGIRKVSIPRVGLREGILWELLEARA